MTCKRPFFSFFLLLLLIIVPVSAQSISFSNLHLVDSEKIDVYEINGANTTYLGEFNSTDSLTLDPALNYQFVLKPSKMDWFMETKSTLSYLTTTDGGQFLNAMMYFVVFGGGLIMFFSRVWTR